MKQLQTTWIGVDWGTSNMRVFAMDSDGGLLAEKRSDNGMARLKPNEFESALLALIEPWLSNDRVMPVFACGMVGARQGWQEAQYRTVPCPPFGDEALSFVPCKDKRITMHILPGLCQQQPCDVMRGEETQVAGLLLDKPAFSGSVCLPGTHSKWVSVGSGRVLSFKTFMTGELFSLLKKQSVLQHCMSQQAWDTDEFLATVLTASKAPENTLADLFSIRASSLLKEDSSAISQARLSGMLIGYELGVMKNDWRHNDIVIIGSSELSALYESALQALNVRVTTMGASQATIAGLTNTANDFFANTI